MDREVMMVEINKQQDSKRQSHTNPTPQEAVDKERASIHNVPSTVERDIDDPQTRFIYIGPDTAVAVDSTSGHILGAKAEGTLSIIIYGGEAKTLKGKRFETEKAIRIPRLLQSDILLNFHVAEIAYHESRQAARFSAVNTVLGATNFYRLDEANTFTPMPGTNEPCYVGFYLSPASQYQVCLVSRSGAWPKGFDQYLNQIPLKSEELFDHILRQCESSQENIFSKLLFLPERMVQDDLISNESVVKTVSRETLGVDYAKREIGGWWFNIPVAVYPWMSANLERLLTGYVDGPKDDDARDGVVNLRSWSLYEWFQLIRSLALGLNALHREGAIHGDPRPANIMTNIQDKTDFGPESFRWIDIGLGYGAEDVLRDGSEETLITPRPLGGGRTTVFYAPEREEELEFEDADVVHLKRFGDQENRSELTFYWREQTHLSPMVLPLKNKHRALRELGRLSKGDRVQVREFVFDVEDVKENSIVVSGIYEVFLDRVLVQKSSSERQVVHERLEFSPISRYRIFQQWSQATDIYGLGMITLYLLFLKGLHALKLASVSSNASPDNPASRNSIYDRTNRERTFSELARLLRNRSFLENLLVVLKRNGFNNLESLWQQELRTPESEVSKKVSDEIHAMDTNFEFIWRGLNGNNGLFIQVIYFCLCCVWRQEEVKEIVQRRQVDFEPFCESRLMIETKEKRGIPSRKARIALEQLQIVSATSPVKDEFSESPDPEALGRSREEQMITLREDLQSARSRIEELKEFLSQNKDQILNREEDLKAARIRIKKLEESLSDGIEGTTASLGKIHETLEGVRQQLNKHTVIFGGVNRVFVEQLVQDLSKLAKKAKILGEAALQDV